MPYPAAIAALHVPNSGSFVDAAGGASTTAAGAGATAGAGAAAGTGAAAGDGVTAGGGGWAAGRSAGAGASVGVATGATGACVGGFGDVVGASVGVGVDATWVAGGDGWSAPCFPHPGSRLTASTTSKTVPTVRPLRHALIPMLMHRRRARHS